MIALKSDYIVKKEPRWQHNKSGGQVSPESTIVKAIRKGLFYVLLVAFVIVSIYVILFSPFLEITTVKIQGAEELQSAALEASLLQQLDGKYLGILPRDNYMVVFPGVLERKLRDEYRKIASVSITKQFPSTLQVVLQERRSMVLWCSDDKCYFIDTQGDAYAPVDFNSPDVAQNHLIRIVEEDKKPVTIGEQVMDVESVQFVATLRERIGSALHVATPETFHVASRLAEDMSVDGDNGLRIYVSKTVPVEKTIETLEMFDKKIAPMVKLEELEYIDVRVENKIFFKKKGAQDENKQETQEVQTQQ